MSLTAYTSDELSLCTKLFGGVFEVFREQFSLADIDKFPRLILISKIIQNMLNSKFECTPVINQEEKEAMLWTGSRLLCAIANHPNNKIYTVIFRGAHKPALEYIGFEYAAQKNNIRHLYDPLDISESESEDTRISLIDMFSIYLHDGVILNNLISRHHFKFACHVLCKLEEYAYYVFKFPEVNVLEFFTYMNKFYSTQIDIMRLIGSSQPLNKPFQDLDAQYSIILKKYQILIAIYGKENAWNAIVDDILTPEFYDKKRNLKPILAKVVVSHANHPNLKHNTKFIKNIEELFGKSLTLYLDRCTE